MKNFVVNDNERRILVVSETREEKIHDYKMFKESEIPQRIPDSVVWWLYNGFQGVETDFPNLTVKMPKRKPKGKFLSEIDKANNTSISRKRIVSEHAIGVIKRLSAVTDIYRNMRQSLEDELMLAACGLWNYHLREA